MILSLLLAFSLVIPRPVGLIAGVASWYTYFPRQAAAGPALRTLIGHDWRGKVVRVCASTCINVQLTDWCQCYGTRVIDLDARSFRAIGLPLSRGITRVTVTW